MRVALLNIAAASAQDLFLNLRSFSAPLLASSRAQEPCEKALEETGLDRYLGNWTVEATGCHAWECQFQAEVTYNNESCDLTAQLTSRILNYTLTDFQPTKLAAGTFGSFGWTNVEEMDGFNARCKVNSASTIHHNMTVSAMFDHKTGAILAFRSDGTNQEPWMFVKGSKTLRDPPPAAGKLLGKPTSDESADPSPCTRYQKELSGPWLVASARGHWGGNVNSIPGTANCTVDLLEYNMTNGMKYIVSTFRKFNVRRLPTETLGELGLDWVAGKSTIAAFTSEASDGEYWGGVMTGWHDGPTDTYIMFVTYQDDTKDILFWRYGN